MVLRVRFEVLGQAVDPFRQEGDLHLGGSSVAFVRAELLDQALLAVEGQRHVEASSNRPPWRSLPVDGFKKPCLVANYVSITVPCGPGEVKLRAAERLARCGHVRDNLRLQRIHPGELPLLSEPPDEV